jgi:hypothetical protein
MRDQPTMLLRGFDLSNPEASILAGNDDKPKPSMRNHPTRILRNVKVIRPHGKRIITLRRGKNSQILL